MRLLLDTHIVHALFFNVVFFLIKYILFMYKNRITGYWAYTLLCRLTWWQTPVPKHCTDFRSAAQSTSLKSVRSGSRQDGFWKSIPVLRYSFIKAAEWFVMAGTWVNYCHARVLWLAINQDDITSQRSSTSHHVHALRSYFQDTIQ